MSLGASLAGIQVKYAIESNRYAAATYRANHPEATLLERDICSVSARDLQLKNHQDVILFGGPPCQGFSTSNQRTRNRANTQNWLFSEYLRLVQEIQPGWVVFENVRGILETENGFFYGTVLNGLRAAGYTLSEWLLNAADFGVPQRRWRVFVVGSLAGARIPNLSPKHKRPITVRDAISDLPHLRNGSTLDRALYAKQADNAYATHLRQGAADCGNHLVTHSADHIIQRYDSIKAGGNWRDIPASLLETYGDPRRYHSGIYKRLKWDEPSIVIGNFRKNMLIHPRVNRGLSVREAARLQSFPDAFAFTGSIGPQQQQVGNAVPPLLARAVFQAILRAH